MRIELYHLRVLLDGSSLICLLRSGEHTNTHDMRGNE